MSSYVYCEETTRYQNSLNEQKQAHNDKRGGTAAKTQNKQNLQLEKDRQQGQLKTLNAIEICIQNALNSVRS
jgi:hypothetical protein